MKRTFLAILLLLPAMAFGQQLEEDSATRVVDRYLTLMNVEGYSADSMLVMETAVTVYGSSDTLWLRRWFAPPKKYRVEQWYDGQLREGLIGNDEDAFLHYNAEEKHWDKVSEKDFLTLVSGYDFRGALYMWRWKGAKLIWNGTTELKGEPLQVIKVEHPNMYDRYYMFEPGSGLLTLIIETEDHNPNYAPHKEGHIDWKSYHEYLPVSNHLVPSLESFMRDGKLTILSTTAHLEPIRPRIFNRE